jgi:hypothetical protein
MIKTLVTVFLLAFFIGCADNYETREAGGKLYRLNKRTGNIDILDGKLLTRISNSAPNDSSGLLTSKENVKHANNKMITDKKLIEKYRKKDSNSPAVGENDEVGDAFPLQCRLPAGTQVDGWFYKGGIGADRNNWIPDTVLTDKQMEAQPWKLFKEPCKNGWSNTDDTVTTY